ncbi:AP2 domain-containing protein [Agrobacterium vitis]|nr:AP2 domain-containing protein [Agrobacterium vitis]MVA35486.1 AP2 domain-containing protein [Agrobacterium vitis]
MTRVGPKISPETRFHDEAMYAVHRVDTDRHRQNAWLVHLTRGGKTIQMTFSDGTYGGKEQALEVAQAYRDAVLRVVPPLTNKDMRMLVRKNRSEGSSVPGVYYIERAGAHRSDIWMARIEIAVDDNTPVPAGKRRRRQFTRSFNVAKYGYEEARRMAEEERIRMVLAVENGEDPALRSPQALTLHQKLTCDDSGD